MNLDRRRFLVSCGGLVVGLPLLQTLVRPGDAHAGGAQLGPRRIITMAYPMGTHPPLWAPQTTGPSFVLPTISAPVQPFLDRCCLISNTPNAVLELGGNSYVYGHPAKKESVLTGTLLTTAFAVGGTGNHVDNLIASPQATSFRTPNGPSVDTYIGQQLQSSGHLRPSVDVAIWGSGGVRNAVSSFFFYESAANPVTLMANPALALATVFNGVDPDTGGTKPELTALRRRRKSVLDAVRTAFVDLRQGLPAPDRAVLDDHADKIRQIELDVPPALSCSVPEGIPAEGDSAYDTMTMMEMGDLANRIVAHAMGCGVAPVARIEYQDQQKPVFGIPLVDDAVATVQDWHHPIVHAEDGWAKDSEPRVTGFTFFVQKLADLLGYLDEIVDGPDGETALDTSLVVLCSDLGDGVGHAAPDTCWLVAGGSGPGRRNYHFDGSGHTVNDVLDTLIAMAGLDGPGGGEFGLTGFGSAPIAALLS